MKKETWKAIIQLIVSILTAAILDPPTLRALRREWRFAPLCGAVATFSGYSKDPSRPLGGEKN